MNQQAGYTLLELLVVLVIMSLLISAVPGIALPGVNSVRFSGRVEGIVDRLQAAHNTAIKTGRPVILQAKDLEKSYRTIVQTGAPTVEFFPDGSTSGGTVVVTYFNRSKALSIDQITGRIYIY